MSQFLPRMMFLALVATCSAGLAADELQWISSDEQGQENLLTSFGAPAAPAAACAACGQQDCACGVCDDACTRSRGCGADCDECPRLGLVAFGGIDSFRGISDGTYQSNFGVVGGVNAGLPIGNTGLAWQLGMSYGIYDFGGRVSSWDDNSACQTQTFITTGFFHKANNGRRLSFGLVYDWMISENWGVTAIDPTMGQWRGQIEYALNARNAIGIYGTKRDKSDLQFAPGLQRFPVSTRAIDQVNVFFHHKFPQGADGRIWIGVPEQDRLFGEGSVGEWLAGCQIEVPLGPRAALYAGAQYMKASASPGNFASVEDSNNVFLGLVFYPGRDARTCSLNGGCSVPYMPVANNSTFLVDQVPTW